MKKIYIIFTLILILLGLNVLAAPTDDQVSYWKFDTNANDTLNIHDLGNNNSALNSSGKINSCYEFNGVDSSLYKTTANISDTNFTLSFWINSDDISNNPVIIANNHRDVALYSGWYVQINTDGRLTFLLYKSDGSTHHKAVSNPGYITNNQWYNVIVTHNDTVPRIYINTTEVSYQSQTNGTVGYHHAVSHNFNIGTTYNNDRFFDGRIDEMGYWNRVLTLDDMDKINNNDDGKQYPYGYGGITLTSNLTNIRHILNDPDNLIYGNTSLTASNITITTGENCIDIGGDSYDGGYCKKNITQYYTPDIFLFPNTDAICYLEITDGFAVENIQYFWYDGDNVSIKNGSTNCENNNLCEVDILTPAERGEAETVSCNVGIYEDKRLFYLNDTYIGYTEPQETAQIGECDKGLTFTEVVAFDHFNNSDFVVDDWVELSSGTCVEETHNDYTVIRGDTGDCIVTRNFTLFNVSNQVFEIGFVPDGFSDDNYITFYKNTSNLTTDYIQIQMDMSPYRLRITGSGDCDDGDGLLLDWTSANWSDEVRSIGQIELDADAGIGRYYMDGILFYTDTNSDCYTREETMATKFDLDQNDLSIDYVFYENLINYPILQVRYFDEITGERLEVEDVYTLNFYDGYSTTSLSGSFSNCTCGKICTNINPQNATINLEVSGNFLLNADGYVSKTISRTPENSLSVSNNPIRTVDLFLISIENSTTITYTWHTPEWQYIDADMFIYSCNSDGTKSLIDTPTISSGKAVSNLQLYSQPYSYEVFYNGRLYQDNSTYSKCHVESTNEVGYLIDVSAINLEPVIGLFLVECGLERVGNNTVKMEWSGNSLDDSTIEACIIGKRATTIGVSEIYRNCTTSTTGSFTRVIPDNGNAYYVSGEITQAGETRTCSNTVSFFEQGDTSKSLGLGGIFAIVILIMSLLLMFAGDGVKQLGGAAIGLMVAFYLGVLSFPIEVVASLIFFLVLIVIIGRYSRKR